MKLVKNTKNENIKFFTNIELGENKDNPHLHIQVWHDNQQQIERIYNKVIERFGLFSDFCKLSLPKTEQEIYDYVIKDYRKDLSDDYLLSLDDSKRIYRSMLEKNIRFSSHSKDKYTKAVYKSLYSKFKFTKDQVNELLDAQIINVDGEITNKGIYLCVQILLLAQYYNKSRNEYFYIENMIFTKYIFLFEFWKYGFI